MAWGVARAAATNRTFASAARDVLRKHPAPEWFRDSLSRARPGQAEVILAASAAARPFMVAAGMHDIARRGGAPAACPVRSRERDGTQCLGRVMTVQCVAAAARLMLALSPMGTLDDIPRTLGRIIETAQGACEVADAGPVFLMDRGFPGAGTLRAPARGARMTRVGFCDAAANLADRVLIPPGAAPRASVRRPTSGQASSRGRVILPAAGGGPRWRAFRRGTA